MLSYFSEWSLCKRHKIIEHWTHQENSSQEDFQIKAKSSSSSDNHNAQNNNNSGDHNHNNIHSSSSESGDHEGACETNSEAHIEA